ncbi:hypothetical protein COCNU_04G010760 [Cocos nucifera]|uniref:Uncharacterized protein n=1 Tax=Cocos nucifera TaxID=13894 RepID=A0A8K0I6A7_COCNU|nr:hypothetical protein COCNU_04G010760 [Cocos nucifera]
MDDEMDDFGDLYGDLEDRVNAGIFRVQENQYSCSAERNLSSSKPGEFDLISEEQSSDDRIGEANERAVASNWGKESPAFGAQESGNSSDSEDDLHIVLNEKDCRKLQPSQGENLGSGGAAVGDDEGEKEDEDLVILYGPDCPQKTQKWGDQLLSPTDGMVQGSTERGRAEKGRYRSWLPHGLLKLNSNEKEARISYKNQNHTEIFILFIFSRKGEQKRKLLTSRETDIRKYGDKPTKEYTPLNNQGSFQRPKATLF